MAAISGLPNFFNKAGPVASDFNDAAKAICTQLGGEFWDEAQGKYVAVPGNLDSSNIAAQAGFKNCQKAEPRHIFQMSAYAFSDGTAFKDGPTFGPTPYEFEVIGIGLGSLDGGAYYVVGGTFDVYLNGRMFAKGVNLPNATAGVGSDFVFTPFHLIMRPGDWILVDLAPTDKILVASAARVAGVAPTPVAPSTHALVTLYCSALDSA